MNILNYSITERKNEDKKKRRTERGEHVGKSFLLLNGVDLLSYVYTVEAHGNVKLRPMCAFFMGILSFIPTTVLCETSFSVYNTIMRSDRTSLRNSVMSDCTFLKSYNQLPIYDPTNTRCFKVDDFKHIYPYVACTHCAETQTTKIDKLRVVCRRKYGSL